MKTLEYIPNKSSLTILELGASNPFAFTVMLKQRFTDAHITLFYNRDSLVDTDIELKPLENNFNLFSETHFTTIKTDSPTQEYSSIVLPSCAFNIEREQWPFTDNKFDVILYMEILEHLVIDPYFTFCEAHRVLKPDGVLIVTTPNISSYKSLAKLIT